MKNKTRRFVTIGSLADNEDEPFSYPIYWINGETYEEAKQIYEYVTENFDPFTEGFYPTGTIQVEAEWDGTIYVYTITSIFNVLSNYVEFTFTGDYPTNTMLISAVINSSGTVYIQFEED